MGGLAGCGGAAKRTKLVGAPLVMAQADAPEGQLRVRVSTEVSPSPERTERAQEAFAYHVLRLFRRSVVDDQSPFEDYVFNAGWRRGCRFAVPMEADANDVLLARYADDKGYILKPGRFPSETFVTERGEVPAADWMKRWGGGVDTSGGGPLRMHVDVPIEVIGMGCDVALTVFFSKTRKRRRRF